MREPAGDLDFEEPGNAWNRVALGLCPIDREVTADDLLVVMLAEAIISGEECRWLGLS